MGEYARQEEARRRAEAEAEAAGEDEGRAGFEEFMRDPLRWFEREMRRQQAAGARSAQRESRGYEAGGEYFNRQRAQSSRQQRAWQEQRGQQQRGGVGGGPPGDPLGYYARLGVSRGASTQELAEAFRGLALKVGEGGQALALGSRAQALLCRGGELSLVFEFHPPTHRSCSKLSVNPTHPRPPPHAPPPAAPP